jgi:anaerobic selenocysteine-containing dehydrogenase
MTIRSHDQFNTTVYALDDRYRGIRGARRVVFLSESDMKERGLSEGDVVDLFSHFGGTVRQALAFSCIPYDIPKHCAAAYFPETNALVPLESVARESRTPTSKSIVITIARSDASAASHAEGNG